MGDILNNAMGNENERRYKQAVERLSTKGYEEIYLLLKDIQMDVQTLYYDERLSLTRNQWAAISRIHNVMKELT
jgi:hypothetical protein